MFTSDAIFLIKLASTYCGFNKTNLIILLCTSVFYILLFLVMLPINIRLAGQLIMQVFKYRYIVNNHATDTDHKVMAAYYQHFKIILGIVCCMIGFNAFNTLFNIYLSVSVSTEKLEQSISDEIRSGFTHPCIPGRDSHIFQIQVYPWLFLTAIYWFDVVVRLIFVFSFLKMTLSVARMEIRLYIKPCVLMLEHSSLH